MSYSLSVKAAFDERPIYTTRFDSSTQLLQTFEQIDIPQREVPFSEAVVVTIRTNSWRNLAVDLFLPTLINQALRVENLALKILAVIGSAIIDIVTFPVRLITLIPRIIYNWQYNSKERHPLYQYLIDRGISSSLLQKDYVYIKWGAVNDAGRESHFTKLFRFIPLPTGNPASEELRAF